MGAGLRLCRFAQKSRVRREESRPQCGAAPNAATAAEYYPAIYWYSMLKIPDKRLFPGTGAKGNGMAEKLKRQGEWLNVVKTNGCMSCHQLGNKATRTLPEELAI